MDISDEQFKQMIARAMDELPRDYMSHLDNVAITYADEPTDGQLKKQGVRENHLLLGLYEGIPQTARGSNYSFVLPDKITIFKLPLISLSANEAQLFERVKRTLWHEIAHHFGLDHDRIDELEARSAGRQ